MRVWVSRSLSDVVRETVFVVMFRLKHNMVKSLRHSWLEEGLGFLKRLHCPKS